MCRYIRFIYNRVLLECATVRAAAVSALARFGALCDDLLPNILVLLSRCQMDSDDEVSKVNYHLTRIMRLTWINTNCIGLYCNATNLVLPAAKQPELRIYKIYIYILI